MEKCNVFKIYEIIESIIGNTPDLKISIRYNSLKIILFDIYYFASLGDSNSSEEVTMFIIKTCYPGGWREMSINEILN